MSIVNNDMTNKTEMNRTATEVYYISIFIFLNVLVFFLQIC